MHLDGLEDDWSEKSADLYLSAYATSETAVNSAALTLLPKEFLRWARDFGRSYNGFANWYYWLFFLGEVAAFIYKGVSLRYPPNLFAYEALLLLLLLGMEVARNSFGRSGNLTESFSLLAVSLFLAAPCVLAYGYLLYYQTYVVRVEVVLTIVSLLFVFSEMTFSLISMIWWLK